MLSNLQCSPTLSRVNRFSTQDCSQITMWCQQQTALQQTSTENSNPSDFPRIPEQFHTANIAFPIPGQQTSLTWKQKISENSCLFLRLNLFRGILDVCYCSSMFSLLLQIPYLCFRFSASKLHKPAETPGTCTQLHAPGVCVPEIHMHGTKNQRAVKKLWLHFLECSQRKQKRERDNFGSVFAFMWTTKCKSIWGSLTSTRNIQLTNVLFSGNETKKPP